MLSELPLFNENDSHSSNDTNWLNFKPAHHFHFWDKKEKLKGHKNIFWQIRKYPQSFNHCLIFVLLLHYINHHQFDSVAEGLSKLFQLFACPSPILAGHLPKTSTYWSWMSMTEDNHKDTCWSNVNSSSQCKYMMKTSFLLWDQAHTCCAGGL